MIQYFYMTESLNPNEINELLSNEVELDTHHHDNEHVKSCNIVVAHGPDPYAAHATLIWLYPINFLIYAERNNMVLWIDFNNDYNSKCFDASMGDENVWNYYLQPINPRMEGCDINSSNLTVLSKHFIWPQMHYSPDWAVRAWYYHWRHHHRKDIDYNMYYENWYYTQRRNGYNMVQKYFKYKASIITEVEKLWNGYFGSNSATYEILGVHMRGTDKAAHRRKVVGAEYMDYMNKFVEYYGKDRARIVVATDDANYLLFIENNFKFDGIWFAQNGIVRSSTNVAVFNLKDISKYEIGKQVIVDILLLSRCDWFIHSASAVSEAVFYNNVLLHNQSVHLEYTKNRQVPIWYA